MVAEKTAKTFRGLLYFAAHGRQQWRADHKSNLSSKSQMIMQKDLNL